MALIRDLFLWAIISFHVVGAAIVFRRYFPKESPWFGFLLPAIAFPLLLNFIEHFVALPSLLWLLPFTLGGFLYFMLRADVAWEGLRAPIVVFLVAFAFTLSIRSLSPDIQPSSDGLNDANIVYNYCQGEKVPPTDNWLPTLDYKWYYSFQHYAASVVKRLFNVDGGTAVNASNALLAALTSFAAAAVAFRLSGGKTWVALVMVFLIEAAFTGSSAYIYLTMKDPGDWLADNLSGGFDRHDGNPLWHLLGFDTTHIFYDDSTSPMRRELQVGGFWTWRDEYHANSSGHFFTLLSLFTAVELLRREQSSFPWICAILIPPLVVITTLWLIVVDGLLCFSALGLALAMGLRPGSWKVVFYGIVGGLVAVWPAFSEMATGPESGSIARNPVAWVTGPLEFVVQFWPVILLWLMLWFYWRTLPAVARLMLFLVPIFLIGIELFNIQADRYNTYEKMWGSIFSAGLVCFFPIIATKPNLIGRLLAVIIFFCAMVSLTYRAHNLWIPWGAGVFNLQGDGVLMADPQKKRLVQIMSQFKGATALAGRCDFAYYESPAVEVFTGNRSYIAWFFGEEHFGHGGESGVRTQLNNDFYDGKMSDPLGFLTSNNIDAVVIWPGDKIPDSLIDKLKTQLAPTYQYEDCREGGDNNAGVFVRRPLPVVRR